MQAHNVVIAILESFQQCNALSPTPPIAFKSS